MMNAVGKSTSSGFKTGFYISYLGGNAVRYMKQRGFHDRWSNASSTSPPMWLADHIFDDCLDVLVIFSMGIKVCSVSSYFDAKYMTVLQIEQILHNFEDKKMPIF